MMFLLQDGGFWKGDAVEFVLFSAGILFTLTLLAIFLYVLTRRDEAGEDHDSDDQ
jgi:hypothetical protein